MLLVSLRRASPTVGMPDSLCGLPIEEGDILMPPIGGAGPPAIFIRAENEGRRLFGISFAGPEKHETCCRTDSP